LCHEYLPQLKCFAMRKIYSGKFQLCLMAAMLISVSTFSQGFYNTVNWKFSNPKKFGFTVLDVDFFDNNNVIAVGGDGGIAKSTDGGTNWTYGPFTFLTPAGVATKPSFSDVHYITANIAYAVGTGGCMAKTTDGGANWAFVNTPLRANGRSINACWFLNKDTGYIGGQFNTADSVPKLYFTRNGGATWDSMAAPIGGKTRVGYVNNPNMPSLVWDINSKGKDIYRIEFINDSTGYVIGGSNSGFNFFPFHPAVATSGATACQPNGTTTTTGAQDAGLVWKFSKGTLTDYSPSKERLGYNGIYTAAVNCSTRYASNSIHTQVFRAMNIINDSTLVMMSFNNNIVIRVRTGKNDSTANINVPGVFEKGKYELLNAPFPPINNNTGSAPAIPNPNVLLASNPYYIKRAANGKLYAPGNFGLVWTSVDTGRNWVRNTSLPQGQNYSAFGTWALDIAPNGKFLYAGTNGVVADSMPGSPIASNYVTVPAGASYNKIEFADCNNGIATGGSFITVTTDGGNTWVDKQRPDFAASFYSINGLAYPNTSKTYIAVSNGIVYSSPDKGTTLDPSYNNPLYQMQDVATSGNDTVWAVGSSQFSVAAALRTSKVFRSINNGATWTEHGNFPVGTTYQILTDIEFPSRNIGYAAGNRDTIWKTIDGGTTWNKLPLPTPGVTPQISYTDMFALNDNVVFLTGNGFPRKVVFRTTDGGNTWTNITSNIPAIYPVGNMNGVLFHDINNGYVVGPGGALLKTTNGGTSWELDIAPTNSLFSAMAFAPRTVPPSIGMVNRRLFVVGPNLGGAPLMEYGNPANTAVNATENITAPTCSNLSGGSLTINATGGITPYTYSINGGAFQTGNTFTGLTQGPKTITIKDAFCGTLTKTVNVPFNDNLTLAVSNDTLVCAGAPVPLLATSAGASFAWSPATGLSNTNTANPTATVSSNAAYTVTATLNGCTRTRTVNIGIKPNPIINAGPDKTIVDGDAVQLDGVGNPNAVSVAWTPVATLTNATTYTPTAKPSLTTAYTLTVRDANGCTSTDAAIVTVIPYCVKVMDAFSPNGDGINDKWLVTNGAACAPQIIVNVFNRYGSPVYRNDNYKNDWDGTYKGKPVPDATYYYVVTYRLLNGRTVTVKGDVTILR
jgi:gliding motility-associated-like protein